ncbi:toll-like receptor 2 type-1 [Sitophilus oryzae]|uniref:Toll-like receptor 2 type-1 n=1 Tax=Sitophilus oryzae TaxID=7048 RepID=A0A6J2XZ98_SITOR|nr:toll-like receptor 2 type-1 [Sitophilus oryzae]
MLLNFQAIILILLFVPRSYSNCKDQKCKTTRIHGLKSSDCFNMNWKEFPKCLSSDVEVVDLSFNRIRKISRSDFQKHPHIKYLYLADNLITNIEENTFEDLDKLETLDLSLNALGKLPPTIFKLPSLKTLYLSQNTNLNLSESIQDASPISSPITKLDVSLITSENEPKDFPDFGEMIYLAKLNITGNQFNYIVPKHFAGLCNLQILDHENVTAFFKSSCDCWVLNNWLEERNVKFSKFICSVSEKDCSSHQLSEEDSKIYETCLKKLHHVQQSKFLCKIGIGVGITIGIICIIALIVIWRWRKNKIQRKHEQVKTVSYDPVENKLLNK